MTAPNNRRGQPVPPDAKASDFARFLKSAHLEGKPLRVTIHSFTREETHPRPNESEIALIMHFHESIPPLVLSPTNRDALADLFGNRLGNWIGKQIELYPHKVRVGRVEKCPVRVRFVSQPAPADAPADPLVAAVVNAAAAAGIGQTDPPVLTGDPVVDAFAPTTHVPAAPATTAAPVNPGHREWKAYCDKRNMPQTIRNEFLRKHHGSYADAIAELEAELAGEA